jgi:hypothetical protein
VDPENRLVASTLERRWNDALVELEKVRQQIADLNAETQLVTAEHREQILALASDLPRLWYSPHTSAKDKKRILQLLINDITLEKPERYRAVLHIRWQGGLCEDIAVELPRPTADRWRHDESLVAQVRELAKQFSDDEIAAQLNAQGVISRKGRSFTRASISWIRYRHKIPAVQKKLPHELTVAEVAKRFGVSHHVVYDWISRRLISARRLNRGSPLWITLEPEKSEELKNYVRESSRITSR